MRKSYRGEPIENQCVEWSMVRNVVTQGGSGFWWECRQDHYNALPNQIDEGRHKAYLGSQLLASIRVYHCTGLSKDESSKPDDGRHAACARWHIRTSLCTCSLMNGRIHGVVSDEQQRAWGCWISHVNGRRPQKQCQSSWKYPSRYLFPPNSSVLGCNRRSSKAARLWLCALLQTVIELSECKHWDCFWRL